MGLGSQPQEQIGSMVTLAGVPAFLAFVLLWHMAHQTLLFLISGLPTIHPLLPSTVHSIDTTDVPFRWSR